MTAKMAQSYGREAERKGISAPVVSFGVPRLENRIISFDINILCWNAVDSLFNSFI